MKRIYVLLFAFMALSSIAMAQPAKLTLKNIISQGVSGEFYTVRGDLVGVYVSPHCPNVIFAKDDNDYANKSHPTTEQYEAGLLYDEKDGTFDEFEEWNGSFDQSNWVKIVLPEGEDAHQFLRHKIKSLTVTGRINIQEYPTKPLGLTITIMQNPATPDVPFTLPVVGDPCDYNANLYCCGNFVKQEDYYFVKPQNQEYVNIRWAVWHAADTMFYAPARNGGINQLSLPGSFKIDMSLWEPEANKSPFDVFQDEYQYEFPAIVEFFVGSILTINIDPGFSGENNIHFAPRRVQATDNPGVPPTYTDEDGVVYPYNVLVYPLRLDKPGEFTGADDVLAQPATVVGKRYVDLQGRVSSEPFQGLNVVQTTYSDGSVQVYKYVKNNH